MDLIEYENLFLNHGFARYAVSEYNEEGADFKNIHLKHRYNEEEVWLYFSQDLYHKSTAWLLIDFDIQGMIEISMAKILNERILNIHYFKYDNGRISFSIFDFIDHIMVQYPNTVNVIIKNMDMFTQ